jgi:hypothetical protein
MTIVNDDSRVVNKLETLLTDNARVVIYDRHLLIVQSTEYARWRNKLECLSLPKLTFWLESIICTNYIFVKNVFDLICMLA